MTTAAKATNATIANQQTEITTLTEKVTELGGQPSGSGSVLETTEDEATKIPKTTGKLPRYDDPNHPANKAAAGRRVRSK